MFRERAGLILTNAIVLLVFGLLAIFQRNIEFLYYLFVVIVLAGVLIASLRYVEYPAWILWLLSGWAWLHMAGGLIPVHGSVLYNLVLVPIVGDPYLILKFDQLVHLYGFFAATLTMWYVLRPHLGGKAMTFGIGLTVFAAGLGLGALNEVVEFLAVVAIPDTNVGGYVNTGMDLVFNTFGAALAIVLVKYRLR